MPHAAMYIYKASLHRVIDGDTVVLIVDLGFTIKVEQTFRLYGINCPEKNTPEGKAAAEFTRNWFTAAEGKTILISSYKPSKPLETEKYGRYLVSIYIDGENTILNHALVQAGHAVYKSY